MIETPTIRWNGYDVVPIARSVYATASHVVIVDPGTTFAQPGIAIGKRLGTTFGRKIFHARTDDGGLLVVSLDALRRDESLALLDERFAREFAAIGARSALRWLRDGNRLSETGKGWRPSPQDRIPKDAYCALIADIQDAVGLPRGTRLSPHALRRASDGWWRAALHASSVGAAR